MKLKFKKGIFLSLAAIALLSMGSCKDKSAPSDLISENDQKAINKFDKNYFAKYNHTFIPNTDDEKFNKEGGLGFHTWAWQKYLHLTQSVSPDNSSKIDVKNGRPYFLVDKSIKQITPNGDEIEHLDNEVLKLDIINQAGSNDPILKSNPKFLSDSSKTEYTVFYSIHMNNTMIKDMKDGATKLIESINVKKATIDKDTINIPDTISKYSNGALELKAAWIDIEAIPKKLRKDYIQVKNVSIKNLQAHPNSKKQYDEGKTVALIGLHIVGMVNDFPELLWSTFEGRHLAPDNLHNLTDNLSKKNDEKYAKVNSLVAKSDNHLLFYREGETEKQKSIDYSDKVIDYKNFINMDDNDKQVYRKYPLSIDIKHFTDSSETSKGFVRHANLMNAMNKKGITHKNIKMAYNGNIWLTDGNKFKNLLEVKFGNSHEVNNKYIAGSPNATNITMESYMQNTQCFSCHGGRTSIKKEASGLKNTIVTESFLNTSHIFRQYLASQLIIDSQKSTEPSKLNTSKFDREQVLEYIKRLDEIQMESGK